MQPLAAFLLVKLPTGKLLAGAIFFWGTSQALMAACTDFKSLAALRFLLGTFEAPIGPICVAVTQMWWRRSEQTLRNSYWNAMNGITFIVGSLFTYGLGHIQSNALFSYQIIFMFCGLLTVAYSFLVLFYMPDSPMEAKYLTQREKVIATERIRANQQGVISRKWKWDHVWDTATDLKTYCWFLLIMGISIPSGGIGTFGSLIIRDFGYGKFTAILFNIPFGVVQMIAIIGSAWLATMWQRKGFVITIAALFPITGTVLLLTVPRHLKGVLLFGYYLVRATPQNINFSRSDHDPRSPAKHASPP
jgi:MFS family permease